MSLPETLANRALDAAGSDEPIGNIQDGSRESKIIIRHYGPVLRQLLRAAHWDMARKQAPLQLLADATGQTANVGNQVPAPWIYEYAYPIDCMKLRFVPLNPGNVASASPAGNIALPATPLMTGLGQPSSSQPRLVPTRFLIATDYNYPAQIQTGPGGTEWWNIQGISPSNRTVILTNVQQAIGVYTCLQTAPSLWDALFEAAFVAALAEKISVPLDTDPTKKKGIVFRDRNIVIAKECIRQARVSDGNEMWTTTDHVPDWIRVRNSGAWGSQWGGGSSGGPGVLSCGWDAYGFGDGSAF